MRALRLVLALAVLLSAAPARAAYEDLGVGARAPGLGNAFVPIADDLYALHYNPAGLGLLTRPELGTSYTVLYPGMTDGSNLSTSFIGYAQPLAEGRQGTLATAWNAFSLGGMYREDTAYLGYGRRWATFGDDRELYGGAALKYLHSGFGSFPETTSAVPSGGLVGGGQADPLLNGRKSQEAIDGDAGLLYRLGKNYSVGVDVMHVNQPNVAFAADAKDRLPMAAKAGVAYRSLISNLAAQYETRQAPDGKRDQLFTAAAERWFPKLFMGAVGLRGAMTIGTREEKQASAGLSYKTRRFSADYAMALPFGGVSTTFSAHRVALTFRFGRATDEEESLEMVLEAMRLLASGRQPKLREHGSPALDEYLAQERASERRARYREALDSFTRALSLAPTDEELAGRYQRLSFVAAQIRELPRYRTDPLESALQRGIAAYLDGSGAQAVESVSKALALAPERKDVESFLASLEAAVGVKRGVFASAKRPDYQIALKLTRAAAALEDGRWDEAVALSLEVVRADGENAAAWENLGTAYFALKQFEDSRSAWNRAYELEKNPAVREAIRGYLRSIARQKPRPSAVKPAAQPLPARPTMTKKEEQDLFDQAVEHYTKREFSQAKALLETVLAADPDNVEAQKALRRIREEAQ